MRRRWLGEPSPAVERLELVASAAAAIGERSTAPGRSRSPANSSSRSWAPTTATAALAEQRLGDVQHERGGRAPPPPRRQKMIDSLYMTDSPKPPHEDPWQPQLDPKSAAIAVVKTAAEKLPIIGVLMKWASHAEHERRERRRTLWAEWLQGDDGEHMAQLLDTALHGGEADLVRSVVLDSARAVDEAIAESIIPSIGTLTNLFLRAKKPDLRTYWALLAVLKGIDGDEFDALASAVRKMHGLEDPLDTLIVKEVLPSSGPEPTWVWRRTFIAPDTTFVVGDLAPRVVAALYPLSRDAF